MLRGFRGIAATTAAPLHVLQTLPLPLASRCWPAHRCPQLSVERRRSIARFPQYCGKNRAVVLALDSLNSAVVASSAAGGVSAVLISFPVNSESLIKRKTPPAIRKYVSTIRTPGCGGLSLSMRTHNRERVSSPILSAWHKSARYRTPSKVVSLPKPKSAASAWLLRCVSVTAVAVRAGSSESAHRLSQQEPEPHLSLRMPQCILE